jgi:hypothetical protein
MRAANEMNQFLTNQTLVMKKVIFLVCLATFALGSQVFSQTNEAIVTQNGAVLLNEQEPLQSHYTINADQFNFQSDQQAINYFNGINTEYVVYRPTLYNGKVNIYLQTKKQPDWTVEDWNTYLAEHKVRNSQTSHQTSK